MNREEWIEAKRGMISASNAYKLLGSEDTMDKYVDQLTDELGGGIVIQSGLEYCDKGLDIEPVVIDQFMNEINNDPDEPHVEALHIPIIRHPDFYYSVCSPDRMFINRNGDKFGLEVKCKFDTPKNYDKSWQSILKKPNNSHVTQCQFSLWCTQHHKVARWILLYAHITEEDPTNDIELLPYEITPDQDMHQRFEERVKECWSMASDNRQSMV